MTRTERRVFVTVGGILPGTLFACLVWPGGKDWSEIAWRLILQLGALATYGLSGVLIKRKRQ